MFFSKVAAVSDTIGAVATAKSALMMLCSFNGLSTIAYTSLRVNATLESMRRRHAHQVRKAAGLTVRHVGAIMGTFGFVRPDQPTLK